MVENCQPDSCRASRPGVIFEYSRPAFHAIQETVLSGDCKFPKGREEWAGVLYGTREGNIVRVQVARRIACEHARGQTFLLSANDRAALREQLAREAAEPALQGLAVVGWFLSHASPIRTAMTANGRTVLSSADLQTFDEYFGTPGQVTLVLQPRATTTMQASVFARGADGSVNAGDSDLNFPFTEAAAFTDRAKDAELRGLHAAPAVRETALAAAAATMAATVSVPAARQAVPARIPGISPSAAAAAPAPAAPPELAPAEPVALVRENSSAPAPPVRPRIPKPVPAANPGVTAKPAALGTPPAPVAATGGHNAVPLLDLKPYPNFGSYSAPVPRFTLDFAKFFEGFWGIAGLVLLAGVASMPLGVKYYRSLPESVPISLTMSDRNGQIQVRWNHSSRVIREAAQGSIEILDGTQSRSEPLSADDLSHGSIIYMRQSGDVQIRLEVENAQRQTAQEVAHFIEPHP